MLSRQQTAMLGGAANAKVASYVLVAADAGDAITMSNASPTTITVNTGLFAAGDIVTIINLGAGACTITAGTATVDTSGSLVLATNQGGVLRFTSASAAIFFQFATPASGDIEGVTAGTGISGGGTSGTVTITNSMATAIDAKGDLIVGTGADTFARLAVSATNGHTLVADSAQATGLKWAAPGGGSFVKIATGTANGSSGTVSFNNVFTSTYTNYFINYRLKGSEYNSLIFRYRASGSDDSSAVYDRQITTTAGATASPSRALNESSHSIGTVYSVWESGYAYIYQPQLSERTLMIFNGVDFEGFTNYNNPRTWFFGGVFDADTAFDGFSIVALSGNLTGTVEVYGLEK
jgi:hypothetical protein